MRMTRTHLSLALPLALLLLLLPGCYEFEPLEDMPSTTGATDATSASLPTASETSGSRTEGTPSETTSSSVSGVVTTETTPSGPPTTESSSTDELEAELVDYDENCDLLQTGYCSFPWPSRLYLEEDETRGSGYTLAFGERSLPRGGGRFIRPEAFRRLDGYGLGSPIMVLFPSLDDSNIPNEFQVEQSMEADADILLFRETDEGLVRVPWWGELDAQERSAARRTLFIRPAKILEENARYIVAMRNLQNLSGNPIAPSPAFARLRDGRTAEVAQLAARQERFDEIFTLLEAEGVERGTLTLAWDFHTASTDGLHRIMLHMRDDAFERVGAEGPALTIHSAKPYGLPESEEEDTHPHIAWEIEGTFEVPHYVRAREFGGETGYVFELDENGLPQAEGTRSVDFVAIVPHSAVGGESPHGVITYGHGLLGSRWEIRFASHIPRLANEFNWIVVAADLVGMSAQDAPVLQQVLTDLSDFTVVGDRLHQGMLEYLLLTRAAKHHLEDALADEGITVSVDTENIAYFGGSQGGIFGATFAALSEDVENSFLAVPGNNYATLLQRSTNFRPFADALRLTYTPSFNLNAVVATVQLLWDGTDPVSYVRRISHDPFPGQEPSNALFVLAKADWQVAVLTNEHIARSFINIPIVGQWDREYTPPLVDQVEYPHTGSGIINYDFGNPWPVRGNRPPDDEFGDPHSLHATVDEVGFQLDTFLRDGVIVDVCDEGLCYFPPEED